MCVVIDRDNFKQVNDTLGHAAGDLVLRHVARIMTEVIRKEDTAFRVGGGEFLIVFAGLMQAERLGEIAADLVHRIEEPVTYDRQVCRVSASIGIATGTGGIDNPDELLEQADMALYASKRAGRAQFHFFGEAPAEGGAHLHGDQGEAPRAHPGSEAHPDEQKTEAPAVHEPRNRQNTGGYGCFGKRFRSTGVGPTLQ